MMKRMTEQVKDDVQKIMQEFGNLVHDRLNAYLRQTLGLPVCIFPHRTILFVYCQTRR
uniref:Uncharacterized protein n=1 Tax=Ciona intestinalis TaxID=7719 RepID=H2XLH7_CIOIN